MTRNNFKSMRGVFVALALALASTVMAQGYTNPVIPGYYPDPSVCRVGEDFYLVNSSFQYFPGVPIFHSRDLIHWEQIGNVLDRESQLPLKGASSWTGIYAPTIRYNDGTFYMITTNVGGKGNFFVTATDPRGPWSEPVWLKQGGIDPSLYFEDGRCYMVSNPDDGIWLCEIDPKTGKQLTESKMLWQGDGGRYPEAPHIYRKDGYYYLLIAEGGTEFGHKLTVARSRNIYGPYESNPDNPILYHQRRITQSSQIQGTGHGDFVQAANGSWWVVFLAFRTYGGNYHHLGRETFLAPMQWEEGGWPVVNGNGTVDLKMNVKTLPQHNVQPAREKYDFGKMKSLGPEWVYLQNPVMSRYQFTENGLRLHVSESSLLQNDRPTFVGHRQQYDTLSISTEVDASALKPGAEAGLAVYQIHDGCYRFYVTRDKEGTHVWLAFQVKNLTGNREVFVTKDSCVKLVITSDGIDYRFVFSAAGQQTVNLVEAGALSCPMLSSEVAGGFTGVVIGMYATGKTDGGYADFKYYNIDSRAKMY